jgi:hypothetical protein
MNHIKNDLGEWAVAVGADGSIERCKVAYPKLIKQLNDLYYSAYECFGKAVDKAVEMIREAGIKSELETNSILAASHYGQEPSGSVTALTASVTKPNSKERFKAEYVMALRECIQAHPDIYAFPDSDAELVAGRMFAAMDKGSFSHTGHAYKLTCKRLGIKHTRAAVVQFWNS